MSGMIIYKSKYGATKKYANWLAQETGFAAVELETAKINEIKNYDVIVLGGGIYASGIAGVSFLRKHLNALREKKIIIFCDGASPFDQEAFQEIIKHNLKEDLKDIPCFYCRGGWDLNAMSFFDKNLCKLLRKAVAKKDPTDYEIWEKALMAAGEDKCDWTDKEYIKPILEEINKSTSIG